ncbi:MAG: DUF6653 family protein [Pseudomonadota bacterium]
MDIFAAAGHAMRMDAQAWSRHANPLSVFSRILGGSAVFLALWSVHWIGWFAVAPIGAAVLWIWLNPRPFPPPTHTEAWATWGVLGERAFLNRAAVPVPDHHRRAAWVTTAMALAFLLLTAFAFIKGDGSCGECDRKIGPGSPCRLWARSGHVPQCRISLITARGHRHRRPTPAVGQGSSSRSRCSEAAVCTGRSIAALWSVAMRTYSLRTVSCTGERSRRWASDSYGAMLRAVPDTGHLRDPRCSES